MINQIYNMLIFKIHQNQNQFLMWLKQIHGLIHVILFILQLHSQMMGMNLGGMNQPMSYQQPPAGQGMGGMATGGWGNTQTGNTLSTNLWQ
jgi:hypothetical protein